MIPEIDKSSVVDETESAKVTTESQMAECSIELMRRPETTGNEAELQKSFWVHFFTKRVQIHIKLRPG